MGIWDYEDNIVIDSNIICVVYIDIPRKRLAKKKDGASKYDVAQEPASELSSDERGDVEVVKSNMMDFY